MKKQRKDKLPIVMGIYGLISLKTNKVYVGRSKHVSKRARQHIKLLNNNLHDNKELQKEWDLYGEFNFKFTFFEQCKSSRELYKNEKKWIRHFKDKNQAFNVLLGGSRYEEAFYLQMFNGKYDWILKNNELVEQIYKMIKQRVRYKDIQKKLFPAIEINNQFIYTYIKRARIKSEVDTIENEIANPSIQFLAEKIGFKQTEIIASMQDACEL